MTIDAALYGFKGLGFGCNGTQKVPKAVMVRPSKAGQTMKRYRVFSQDFDTRPYLLSMEIRDEWEKNVKQFHLENRERLLKEVEYEFGQHSFDMKLRNFKDIGTSPFSVIAYHNKFLRQIRASFVAGSYYPALTGVCALGERVLNHLLLKLRSNYSHTPEYKKVYRKNSFDKWEIPIGALTLWGVLLPETTEQFEKLKELRNNSIHFNPETDHNDRALALKGICTFQTIVEKQFSAIGDRPWFITDIPGETYIKKDWEDKPFIKEIYLPNCVLVGPKNKVLSLFPFKIEDPEYPPTEISDEEFVNERGSRDN